MSSEKGAIFGLPLSLKGPENSERDFYEGVLSFT
jgi:hypothetical protein